MVALIVDGYNVIFAEAGHVMDLASGTCERLRTALLERLEFYRTQTGEEITVVFDGGAGGAHLARLQHHGGLTVIFSDPSEDADTEIKRLVRESSGSRELRVVTDDRSIERAVKRFRARVSSTEDLLRKLRRAEERAGGADQRAEPSFKYGGPPESDVDAWVDVFGDLDEEDLDEDDR
ncbi:MAG TPA: NYN domain-containing protein [Planctomycetota bacterium]|nr:NYN domain-containing protein [Planctomycetota bacterium]